MASSRRPLRPFDIPHAEEPAYRLFARARIRGELARLELLGQPGSAWPKRKPLMKVILKRWPAARQFLPLAETKAANWSRLFGEDPKEPPTGRLEDLLGLYWCICASAVAVLDQRAHLRNELEKWKRSNSVDGTADLNPRLAIRLVIPASLDGLLIGGNDIRTSADESKAKRSRSKATRDEHEHPFQAEVASGRFSELIRGQRPSSRKPSSFFYMSWQRALDAQRELNEHGDRNEKVLVLDQWTMATTPAYCLLQGGHAEYLAKHANRIHSELGDSVSDTDRRRRVGEWLRNSTVICARESTAASFFVSELEKLKEEGFVDAQMEPLYVSSITPLMELMAKRVVPDEWVLVGGPLQYWMVRESKFCHILDATQEVATRVQPQDRDSHYLIATRPCFLNPSDPSGQRSARVLRESARGIQDRFNDRQQRQRDKYRVGLAERLLPRFETAVGHKGELTRDGILRCIEYGMNLRIGSKGEFVSVEQFIQAPRASQSATAERTSS